MARGDWWSVSATLVAGGVAYFIGGAKAAIGCIVVGLLIAVVLHFTGRKTEKEKVENKPATADIRDSFSPNLKQEANPSFHVHIGSEKQAPTAVSPAKAALEPTPNVRCLGPSLTQLRMGMEGLGFYEQGGIYNSAVVCFRNETLTERKVAAVRNVRAAISFFDKSGSEMGTGVAEACWVGDFRSVDFIVEKSHCVIAAIVFDGKVTCPYIRRTPSRWGGDHCVTDVYRFDEPPGRLEIRLIKNNDLLMQPCIFDFALVQGKPILKQRA